MTSKVSFQQFSDSQFAIRDYIHANDEHWGTHKARVKVWQAGRVIFDETISVVALIETNESFVEVIWPDGYENTYYVKYSNQYQVFEYVGGTLDIKCRNKNDDNIIISIG